MKNRMKNLIAKAKGTITDWWRDYGDETIIIFLMSITVMGGVAATSYWRGRYDGANENRNH